MGKNPRCTRRFVKNLPIIIVTFFLLSSVAQSQVVNLNGQYWVVRDRGPEQMANRLPVPVNVNAAGYYRIKGLILYNSGNHQLNESFFFTLEDANGNELTPVDANAAPSPYKVVPDDSVENKHSAWRDGGLFYIPEANTDYTLIINHYARIWDAIPYFLNPRLVEAGGRNAESLNIQKYELISETYQPPVLDGLTDLAITYDAITGEKTIVNGEIFPALAPGGVFQYNAIIKNSGPNDLSKFRTWVDKPDTVEFSNFSVPPTFFENGKYFWDLGRLDQNQTMTLTWQATASGAVTDLPFPLPSLAGVYSAKDTTVDNNFDSTKAYITQAFVPATVDISVAQFSVTDSIVVENGDTTKYVDPTETYQIIIRLTNKSMVEAQNVMLTDVLPAGVTTSGFNPPLSSSSGDSLFWQLPTLAPASSALFSFLVTVPGELPVGTNLFINEVFASAANENPDSTFNNTSLDTVVNVVAPPALLVDVKVSQQNSLDSTVVVNGVTYKFVDSGETYQVEITVQNSSREDARNVNIVDELPDFISASAIQPAEMSANADSIRWLLNTLPAFTSQTLTFNATVPDTMPLGTNWLINSVTVSAENEHPDSTFNNSVVDTVVNIEEPPPTVDISITQRAVTDSFAVVNGDTIWYAKAGETYRIEISVTNLSNDPALNVTILDSLPAFVSISALQPIPLLQDPNSLSWLLPILPALSSQTLSFNLTLPDSMPVGNNLLINKVNGRAENESPENRANNVSEETVFNIVPAPPVYVDLRLAQVITTDSAAVVNGDTLKFVKMGETYQVSLTVSNVSPDSAREVLLTNIFPSGHQPGGFSPSPAAAVDDTIKWNLGTLAGGERRAVSFELTVPGTYSPGTFVFKNRAMVFAANILPGPVPAVEDSVMLENPAPVLTDISVGQMAFTDSSFYNGQDSVKYVKEGEVYRIQLTAMNVGGFLANNLELTDILPSQVKLVSSDPQPATISGDTLQWSFATLGAREVKTINLMLQVSDSAYALSPVLRNLFSGSAANEDPAKQDNNNSLDSVLVLEPAPMLSDVLIRQFVIADSFKIVNGDTIPIVEPGGTYEINILVRNLGPIDATDLVITDIFPDSGFVHDFNLPPEMMAPDSGSATWNIALLPGNEEIIIKFFITLPPEMPPGETPLPNKVELTVGNEAPGRRGDNSSEKTPVAVYTPPALADIVITHEVLTGSEIIRDGVPLPFAESGETIQFVITVRNLSATVPGLNVNISEQLDQLLTILGFSEGGVESNHLISWLIPVFEPLGEMQFFINATLPEGLPEGERTIEAKATVVADNQNPQTSGDTSVPITVINIVYPAVTASIRTTPATVEVSDSIYVDVRVDGPIRSYDVWVYLPNGDIDSTFADSFVSQNLLNPNEWLRLVPAFIIDYLITTNKEDPVTFEIRAVDRNGNLVTAQATSTIKSGNYLVLDRNVYKAEEGEPLGIRFKLSNRRLATLDVYTINGRHITQITKDTYQGGWNLYPWNGLTDDGQRVGSGVYLVVLRSGEFNDYKKFILVR